MPGLAGAWSASGGRHTALGFVAVSVSGLRLGEPWLRPGTPQTPLWGTVRPGAQSSGLCSLLPSWDGEGRQRFPFWVPAERTPANGGVYRRNKSGWSGAACASHIALHSWGSLDGESPLEEGGGWPAPAGSLTARHRVCFGNDRGTSVPISAGCGFSGISQHLAACPRGRRSPQPVSAAASHLGGGLWAAGSPGARRGHIWFPFLPRGRNQTHGPPWNHMPFVFSAFSVFLAPGLPRN